MTRVFADTSYYLALLVPGDIHGSDALRWTSVSTQPVVTTEYVMVEIANHMARSTLQRQTFVAFLRAARSDRRLVIVPASAALFDRAYDLYLSRPDKSWSLTDCASFVVMRDEGISEALTFDKHFEQAGFDCILK